MGEKKSQKAKGELVETISREEGEELDCTVVEKTCEKRANLTAREYKRLR